MRNHRITIGNVVEGVPVRAGKRRERKSDAVGRLAFESDVPLTALCGDLIALQNHH